MSEKSKTFLDKERRLHRADGPALIRAGGEKRYYRHGLLHRTDGPAVIVGNRLEYWLLGVRYDGPAALLAAIAMNRAAHEGELALA